MLLMVTWAGWLRVIGILFSVISVCAVLTQRARIARVAHTLSISQARSLSLTASKTSTDTAGTWWAFWQIYGLWIFESDKQGIAGGGVGWGGVHCGTVHCFRTTASSGMCYSSYTIAKWQFLKIISGSGGSNLPQLGLWTSPLNLSAPYHGWPCAQTQTS